MKDYELIEHTADIGIRVKGKDLKELFKHAALAMFEIMAEEKSKINGSTTLTIDTERSRSVKNQKSKIFKITLKQKADNLEELFINWLNELLSLSATKEKIFSEFSFKNLDEQNLEAEVFGCDIKNYKINIEIKAATYHELEIKKINSDWEAKIIFDV